MTYDTSSEEHRQLCEARLIWRECKGNLYRMQRWCERVGKERARRGAPDDNMDAVWRLLQRKYSEHGSR